MLERLRAWGYDAAELAVRDPQQIDIAGLERALRASGLPVAALATGTAFSVDGLSFTHPDGAVRQAAQERVAAHCRLAARIGGLVIIGLVRGRLSPAVTRAQAWAWMQQGVEAACAAGQTHGVRLLFEPINRYETDLVNTVAEGAAFVDEIAAPNLRSEERRVGKEWCWIPTT
jgi:sugar phosphate isomerase/epimerase